MERAAIYTSTVLAALAVLLGGAALATVTASTASDHALRERVLQLELQVRQLRSANALMGAMLANPPTPGGSPSPDAQLSLTPRRGSTLTVQRSEVSHHA